MKIVDLDLKDFGDDFAAIFEEWKLRYDEDPHMFEDHPSFLAHPPKSYGEAASRYFIELWNEMAEMTDESG